MDIQNAGSPTDEVMAQFNGEGLIPTLFQLQSELIAHYINVEGLPEPPLNPSIPENQVIFKDFIGRIVEEMGESWEYYLELCKNPGKTPTREKTEPLLAGLNEELADIVAFLIETMIYAGFSPDELETKLYASLTLPRAAHNANLDYRGIYQEHSKPPYIIAGLQMWGFGTAGFQALEHRYWHATYLLQLAKNVLKNKPWKVHQVLSDTFKFKQQLAEAFREIMELLIYGYRMQPQDILEVYYRKNRVNLFRVKSKY